MMIHVIQKPRWHRVSLTRTLLGIVWLLALLGPPTLILRTRSGWIEQLQSPEAQAKWDTFREDMKQQAGREGPVQRKVPKSAEPPLLVWLRDYLWLAIGAWALFSTVLCFFTSVLVMGVVEGATSPKSDLP